MKKGLSILLVLILLLSLTACGGSYKATVNKMESAAAAPMAMAEDAMDNAAALSGAGEAGVSTPPENRKWVVTMYLNAETEDLDTMLQKLDGQIIALEGYVESKNVYHGSDRNTYRNRNANVLIRIPAEKADSFVEEVSDFSNLTSQEKTLEDITLTYVATESRMNALLTEEARLLELLAKAESMEDLLAIEARLSQVRTELENVTTRMRIFDNQVDYATIHLNINEVQEYTPVEEPGFIARIQTTFADALEGLGDSIVDVTVFLVGNSPYLLTFGVIAFVIVKLSRHRRKSGSRKFSFRKNKKQDDQT